MSNLASNVSVGKPATGGAIFRAPKGTTLPTDPTAPLSEDFKCLGYISSDGLTNSQSRETSEAVAWGGDVVLNPQTKKTDTFKFTLIEGLNLEVLKVVYGDSNVEGTSLETGVTVRANSKELDHAVFVVDRIYNDGTKNRTVIPDAQPIAIDDVNYKDNDPIGFPVTLAASPYEGYGGDTHREVFKKTQSGQSGESGQSGISGQSGTSGTSGQG